MNNNLFDGFRITRTEIARGGSAVVHDALSPKGERVALKVLDRKVLEEKFFNLFKKQEPHLSGNELNKKAREAYEFNVGRFKAEYQTLVGFSHPHVARVYKIGFFEGHFYIAYEFVDGKTIAEYLLGKEPVDMLPLFVQALEGLDYIHRNGLIHLDIKSDNILVQEIDGKPQVKIIDFGLAIAPEEYKGSFVGTVDTVAPEVALGWKDKVDARADLFSLGMVMYFCITWGSYPYGRTRDNNHETIRKFIKEEENLTPRPPSYSYDRPEEYPECLDTVIMRLIAHKPENRFYGNARAVINALLTHAPDAFTDSEDSRGAYLKPDGKMIIGRDSEKQILHMTLKTFLQGEQPEHSFIRVTGGDGFGKTHLLNYLKAQAEHDVEKLSVHSIVFPMDEDVLQECLARLTQAIVDNEKPVLVLIDDVHECSSDELEGLANLIRVRKQKPKLHEGEKPILLVVAEHSGSARLDVFSREPEAIASLTMELEPFSRNDVESYLKSAPAFKNAEKLSDYAAKLHSMTSGIPGEIIETLQGLDNQGMVFDAGGRIEMAAIDNGEKQKTAASTKTRLLSIYGSLTGNVKVAADYLACWCFKPFLPKPQGSEIANLTGMSEGVQALHVLVQRGILHRNSADDTYSFVQGNAMARAIYDNMDLVWRKMCHDAIAMHLTSQKEKHWESLALHRLYCTNASTPAIIRGGVVTAKRIIFKRGYLDHGESLLKHILDLVTDNVKMRFYIMGLLVDVHYRQGKFRDAENIYEEAIKARTSLGNAQRIPLLNLMITILPALIASRQFQKAQEIIREAKEMDVEKNYAVLWSKLLNLEARLYYERRAESADFVVKAKGIYEQSEQTESKLSQQARDRIVNNELGTVLFALGEYVEAIPKLEEKFRRDRKARNTFNTIITALTLSETYRMQKVFDKADFYAQQALATVNARGQIRMLPYAHQVRAKLLHDMDKFEEAIEEDRRALAAASLLTGEKEYKAASYRLWLHMGHCFKELKRWNDSVLYFEAVSDEATDGLLRMSASEGAGEVYYNKGDLEEALCFFDKADALLKQLPKSASVKSHQFRTAKLRMEIFLRKGDMGKAKELLQVLEVNINGDEDRRKEYAEMEKELSSIH